MEGTRKIGVTRAQLKEIYDIACLGWKVKIQEFTERNPFGDTMELTQKEVDRMFASSDDNQKTVLEGIFGKQSKDIDLSTGKVDGKTLFDNNGHPNDGLMCVRLW